METNIKQNSSQKYTGLLFLFIVFIALFISSFFTFCWSDESLYLSMVHRLFMGEKPVIDIWIAQQFYSPVILPFYSLYMKLFGSNDGIFLTARLLMIFIHCAVGFGIFFSLKKKWGDFTVAAASVLYMIFCKSNVLGFSYYSFSIDFYMLGILLILNFKKSIPLFLAGVSFAISILSNPFIAVIYIGYSIFYLLKRKWAILWIWSGTILTAIIYVAFLLSRSTISEIIANFSYVFSDPLYGGVNYGYRTLKYFRYLLTSYPFTFPFIIFSVIFLFAKNLKHQEISRKTKLILFIVNLACFFVNIPMCKKFGACLLPPFFLAVVCRLLLNEKLFSGDEIRFFILPGFFLSMIYQWTSDTNISAMAVGFCVASPGILFILFDFLEKFFENSMTKNIIKFAVALSLILTLGVQRFTHTYRDAPIPKCTEKIDQGPAKGLYTTSERKQMYNEICDVMNSISTESHEETIFISPMMPWAYLMYNGKYGAFQTWRIAFSDPRLKMYYETTNHPFPKYVIQLDEKYALSSKEESQDFHGWFYDEILLKQYIAQPTKTGVLWTIKK